MATTHSAMLPRLHVERLSVAHFGGESAPDYALLGTVCALAAAAPFVPKAQQLATVFLGLFLEALPFLLFGVGVSAAVHVLASDGAVGRAAPRNAIAAAGLGAVLGVIVPVCECGAVPVARRLLAKRAPLSLAIAFALAAPIVNPIVAASTWVAFGTTPIIAFARFGIALLVSVLVALLFTVGQHAREHLVLPLENANTTSTQAVPRRGLAEIVRHATGELQVMNRFLVLGALLAATLQTFVPHGQLLGLGHDAVWSVVAAMALAAVLSACSAVDAFVALAFASLLSPGALVAFLVFGPIANIKSLVMYRTALRAPGLALLIVLSAQLVFLGGLTINLLTRL